jgi:hypothetical protein
MDAVVVREQRVAIRRSVAIRVTVPRLLDELRDFDWFLQGRGQIATKSCNHPVELLSAILADE